MPVEQTDICSAEITTPTCFVLSAGRTGTVSLTEMLTQAFPGTLSLHEPFPARWELLLGNLSIRLGLGTGALRLLLTGVRRERLRRANGIDSYIELNPLLCPLCHLLPSLPGPLNVVHLVRDPLSWAQSVMAFRASSSFRWLIDYLPLAKSYPYPRPAGWSGLGELERTLWRWRISNEQIAALRPHCQNYAIIRFEDLFGADSERRAAARGELLRRLPVKGNGASAQLDFSHRANASPERPARPSVSEEQVRAICGPLMATFGYDD